LVSLIIFIGFSMMAALRTVLIYPVSAQEEQHIYLPIFINSENYSGKLATNSYYMITVDDSFLYDLGCEIGTRDQNEPEAQDSVSVLDFSYPICDSELGYGGDLFGFGPVPLHDIENAVKSFALGYYTCTGSDNTSNLVIGVGTNNKLTSCDTEAKAASHGAAWAEMVNSINQWAIDQGIFQQVQAFGASDIEVSWNTPAWSRTWVNGYDQVNQYPLLHFGDAAGCPYSEGSTSTLCGAGWSMEDVWYVSWGAPPSLPLPLIYRTDGIQAEQWAHLSRYSVSQHGARMEFTGVFTQYQACQQATCDGTDNTPYEAYQQLTSVLNESANTAMELNWMTDIRWILPSELPKSRTTGETSPEGTKTTYYLDLLDQVQISLNSPQLDPQMQTSLQEKINLLNSAVLTLEESQMNSATKDTCSSSVLTESTDPEFSSGIKSGGPIAGQPYGMQVNNIWQAHRDIGYIQIAAGSSPDHPQQGALFILLTSLDKFSTQSTLIVTPEYSGGLLILESRDNELVIQAQDGTQFIFDLNHFTLQPKND
jgi:hypothetical protein